MTTSLLRIPGLLRGLTRGAVLVASLALASSALAVNNAGPVAYTPVLTTLEGLIPFSRSYTLTVTSPGNLASSNTISFAPSINTAPVGVPDATVLSYVSFNPTQLTFTGPGQTQTVTVSLSVPAGAAPGAYGYQIYTSGWSVPATDLGSAINMTLSLASIPNPPAVNITTPNDGQIFSYPVTGLPATIPFSFTSTSAAIDPVVNTVSADLEGIPLLLTSVVGLNSHSVTASGTMLVTAPGTYSITAVGTNSVGSATDVNNFTVVVTAPPPTIVINTPLPGTTYTYRAGSATPVTVPYTFTAVSAFGGIRTLSATLDGNPITFTAAGINGLIATGTTSFTYTTAGTHTLTATTTDDYGTATTTSSFIVNVVAPTPTIVINSPANNSTFTLASGATSMNIPFNFTTNTTLTWTVDAVSATLDGNPVAITSNVPALGLAATVLSTGTMTGVTAGNHTLVATGISAGIQVTTSVAFTVNAPASLPPPTVVINTPAVGSTYQIPAVGTPISIPLTFTGDSTTTSLGISGLTAKLTAPNGTITTLTVTPTNIGQKVANGASTMTVSASGTYTITVSSIDSVGTATTTRTFAVTVATPKCISGKVWFDCDKDTVFDTNEFGLSGITVKLINAAGSVVATATTDCNGAYAFSNVPPGTYTVSAVKRTGYIATTASDINLTVSTSNITVANIGFFLDFACLKTCKAYGNCDTYWKSCVDNALKSTGGCGGYSYCGYGDGCYGGGGGSGCYGSGNSVSSTTINCYTRNIGCFAGATFDGISLKSCSATIGSNSSDSTAQLCRQLLTAEYNYHAGAYINGDKNLTYCFLTWGEYVVNHPTIYNSTDRTFAKNWCSAYNNSRGSYCNGPTN